MVQLRESSSKSQEEDLTLWDTQKSQTHPCPPPSIPSTCKIELSTRMCRCFKYRSANFLISQQKKSRGKPQNAKWGPPRDERDPLGHIIAHQLTFRGFFVTSGKAQVSILLQAVTSDSSRAHSLTENLLKPGGNISSVLPNCSLRHLHPCHWWLGFLHAGFASCPVCRRR